MSKYYLAGPMSWIPHFNIPTFESAAKKLREAGYDIISPVEQDNPEVYRLALASETGDPAGIKTVETWGDMLARDVKIIADKVDGLIFFNGWEASRGARLEALTGILCRKKFYRYLHNGELDEMRAKLVLTKIARYTNRSLKNA